MTKTDDTGTVLVLFFLLTIIVIGAQSCADASRRWEKATNEYYQQQGQRK